MKTWRFDAINMALGLAVGAFVVGGACVVSASAYAEQAQARVSLNIPAQSLGSALTEFAKQSGLQIMLYADLSAGLTAPPVVGSYLPADALTLLLRQTDLSYEYINARTVAIRKARSQAAIREVSHTAAGVTASNAAEGRAQPGVVEAQPLDELQVVTVTATALGALGERAELDTPFSMSVSTEEDIRRRQAGSLYEVLGGDAASAPSGDVYGPWGSELSVRGLPLDLNNNVKINGLPLQVFGVQLPVEAFEQVELLKGLAGFMYGFSQPGGIVNYTTKKPTDQSLLSFDAGYRSGSIFSQHVDVGGPIGERFGYRANLSNARGSAYGDARVDQQAAALSLESNLTSSLTLTADLLYQDREIRQPTPYFKLTYPEDGSLVRLPRAVSADRVVASPDSYNDNEFYLLTAGLRWQIAENWNAKVDVGNTRNRFRVAQEYNYFLNPQGDYRSTTWDGLNIYDYRQAQATLSGSFQTGVLSHEVTVGASWYDNDIDFMINARFGGNSHTSNLYAPTRLQWLVGPRRDGMQTYRWAEETQTAVFASDTIGLGEHWSVLAGLRHNRYERDSFRANGTLNASYRTSPSTPTLAVMFKPNGASTLYLSYVEALEQGSTVSVLSDYANAGELLPALKSKQYEAGVKIARRQVRASAAVFRIERGAEYGKYIGTDLYYTQDGVIRHDGIELDGQVDLGNWTVGASTMWLDAAYHEAEAVLKGRRVTGAARFGAALTASYRVPALPDLNFHLDAQHRAAVPVDNNWTADSVVDVSLPSVTVLNLGASYDAAWNDKALTLRARVNNLTGKDYWLGGGDAIVVAPPRTLIVSVEVRL
ncbi:TonB-dependent siderophore receptor [Steroidobacter sp.]|uniref:TonB-dependent siderophore receptor n=1 Tax=Steroidobacter sp. TaxID=1978227 RepID=UPI001A5577C5|nr:TonB-dependent receptor [Steroidobacter sp.]MBL8265768.1 TonB-dependent receptor [Steroidobacter sp.]